MKKNTKTLLYVAGGVALIFIVYKVKKDSVVPEFKYNDIIQSTGDSNLLALVCEVKPPYYGLMYGGTVTIVQELIKDVDRDFSMRQEWVDV